MKKGDIIIGPAFSAKDYEDLMVYVNEMPEDVIKSVEEWLIKEKRGEVVNLKFIARQFINFAKRQNRPMFKEKTVDNKNKTVDNQT